MAGFHATEESVPSRTTIPAVSTVGMATSATSLPAARNRRVSGFSRLRRTNPDSSDGFQAAPTAWIASVRIPPRGRTITSRPARIRTHEDPGAGPTRMRWIPASITRRGCTSRISPAGLTTSIRTTALSGRESSREGPDHRQARPEALDAEGRSAPTVEAGNSHSPHCPVTVERFAPTRVTSSPARPPPPRSVTTPLSWIERTEVAKETTRRAAEIR